jgi:glycosyltransferase involved in cell wall biosynthesis
MIPKISVVIPTHNRPERIKKAIKSVLNQTFQDFEIIVVDDGIKVRAEKEVKSFSDSRIRYIQHEKNKGGSAARNTGIKNAKADWVAFLDDDDEWLSEKLEKQVNQIDKYKNKVDYFFCAIEFYNEKTKKYKIKKYDNINIGIFFKEILAYKIKPYTPTLIVKRDVLMDAGLFDENLPSNQETELMIRVSKKHNGCYLNEVLAKANFLDEEHIGGDLNRRIVGREMVVKKHLNDFSKFPKILSKHYEALGSLHRYKFNYERAKFYYVKSWKHDLKNYKNLFIIIILNFPFFYKCLIYIKNNMKKYIKISKKIFKNPVLFFDYLNKLKKGARKRKIYDIEEDKNLGLQKKKYKNYDDYIKHQKSKLDLIRNFDILKNYDKEYREVLRNRINEIKNILPKGNVLCLAARIGTEVKSFIDLGFFAVGIDLNPGKNNKYVVKGDFHDIQFADNSVDIVFNNSIDHSLYLDKLIEDVKRVLKPGGYFIIELGDGEINKNALKKNFEAIAYDDVDVIINQIKDNGFTIVKRSIIKNPWNGVFVLFRIEK